MSMPPPPPVPPTPMGYAPPPRNDLRDIAVRQKAIMYCILGELLLVIAFYAAPGPLKIAAYIAFVAVSIAAAVFVFMLALAVYNNAAGIVLGILTLFPLIGLIVLLIINGKATSILRAHGIRVGLMGASSSQIPPAGSR